MKQKINGQTYENKFFKVADNGAPCYELYENGRLFGFCVGDSQAAQMIQEKADEQVQT